MHFYMYTYRHVCLRIRIHIPSKHIMGFNLAARRFNGDLKRGYSGNVMGICVCICL